MRENKKNKALCGARAPFSEHVCDLPTNHDGAHSGRIGNLPALWMYKPATAPTRKRRKSEK
jgi:hypothetical protein